MNDTECNRNCWIAAAITGVLVMLFTSGIGNLGLGAGLFLGVITLALFGPLLVWLTCHERPELFDQAQRQSGTDWAREAAEAQPEALLVSGSLGPEPVPLASQMPIMAGAMPAATNRAAPTPKPPAPAKPAASVTPDAAKATPAPSQPDDLKRIKGIGPKLSDWLHENGVTRYEQIAAWNAAAIADFAERLGRMGGRIEADDWVGQARLLAEGRETEFSHRVDDGEVY